MDFNKENYREYPAISSSSLKWILPEHGGSARKYKYYQDFPPEELDSAAIQIGNIAHLYFEKGGDLELIVVDKPTPAIQAVCDNLLQQPKFLAATKPSEINEIIYDTASSMRFQPGWKPETIINKISTEGGFYILQMKSVLLKPNAVAVSEAEQRMFVDGIFPAIDEMLERTRFNPEHTVDIHNEYPILFEVNGMKCKSLIDKLFVNHTMKAVAYLDLKTTSSPLSYYGGYTIDGVEKESQMASRGVIRQMAFYRTALQHEFPDYSIVDARILAVETVAPFDRDVFMIPVSVLESAWKRCEFAIEEIKKVYEEEEVGL